MGPSSPWVGMRCLALGRGMVRHRLKIEVRPNELVQFPGLCIHCAQPAGAWMGVKKRISRVTREIDVPICNDCHHQLRSQSAEEKRIQRIGYLVTALASLLTLAITLPITPMVLDLTSRLLIGLLAGLFVARIVMIYFERARRQASPPVKQAIYDAARIVQFSWRATTFEFANETFSERFRTLNEALLMES